MSSACETAKGGSVSIEFTGLHGRDCPKVPHLSEGYLHAADDDTPYDVDGVVYCGRCHCWLGKQTRAA
jgi:hypothetical protein